jgi:hypothetical protein
MKLLVIPHQPFSNITEDSIAPQTRKWASSLSVLMLAEINSYVINKEDMAQIQFDP